MREGGSLVVLTSSVPESAFSTPRGAVNDSFLLGDGLRSPTQIKQRIESTMGTSRGLDGGDDTMSGEGTGTSYGGTGGRNRDGGDTTRSGDGDEGLANTWTKREQRFNEKVNQVLSHIDDLDLRLASSSESGTKPGFFDHELAHARSENAGVRGALGELLLSPPWRQSEGKTTSVERRIGT